MGRFKGDCSYISYNKCPIYTHDDASAKFSPISHETGNSAVFSTLYNVHILLYHACMISSNILNIYVAETYSLPSSFFGHCILQNNPSDDCLHTSQVEWCEFYGISWGRGLLYCIVLYTQRGMHV
jgi:hypothetical protein